MATGIKSRSDPLKVVRIAAAMIGVQLEQGVESAASDIGGLPWASNLHKWHWPPCDLHWRRASRSIHGRFINAAATQVERFAQRRDHSRAGGFGNLSQGQDSGGGDSFCRVVADWANKGTRGVLAIAQGADD